MGIEKHINEYLMTQHGVNKVEFNYQSTLFSENKSILFDGCQIIIYITPTLKKMKLEYISNLILTLNSLFNLELGQRHSKWRFLCR